ncbi:PREDICTED: adenosine receptor A2a-like [Priapulus caudatus]|uniref:Adenosine receptor A2a-like n=1 Tax=Priapulus caudatus TaxID=37621 RepID=A0ABM1EAR9_PRICU|nr:PREDICTED: adenosine receptor A2a-like [Priapulus caudatus]
MASFNTSVNCTVSAVTDDSTRIAIAGRLILMSTIFLLNTLVLVTLVRGRHAEFRDIKYWFLRSHVLSDIFVSLIYITFVVLKYSQTFCETILACMVSFSLLMFSNQLSTMSLLFVSVDQYIAIVHPLRYNRLVSELSAKIAISIYLLFSLFVGFLPLIIRWDQRVDHFTDCSVTVFPIGIAVFWGIVQLYVPCMLMTTMYAQVLVVAHRHIRRNMMEVQPQNVDVHPGSMPLSILKAELKVAVTVVIMLTVLVVCWLPFNIVFTMDVHSGRELYSMDFVGPLAVTNSLFNPILYLIRFSKLRKSCMVMITLKCSHNSQSTVTPNNMELE